MPRSVTLEPRTTVAPTSNASTTDAYFSADVETDGPVPGPYSMLSFALVYAGSFDGTVFQRDEELSSSFSIELQPISRAFEPEALAVNGLDRDHLVRHGRPPEQAMTEAAEWVRSVAGSRRPIVVAYPLSFDWVWLYWYFTMFSTTGSPFNHSGCYDIKTAYSVKAGRPVAQSGRDQVHSFLRPDRPHTHRALDDAKEQAELFANLFEWRRNER